MAGGEIVLGVLFAGLGAASLALAMSVQRYALVTPPPVPFIFGIKVGQFTAWFSGLLIYWVANGLFAVALIFAPLALLGAIFTTLLVWNLFFGWWLLNEKITLIKALGALIIMLGVSLIGIATPGDIPTEYSKADAEGYLNSVGGSAYLAGLCTFVAICVVIIAIFEHYYPLPEEPVENSTFMDRIMRKSGLYLYQGEEMLSLADLSSHVKIEGLADISKKVSDMDGMAAISKKIVVKQRLLMNNKTPGWLNSIMGVIYPGSLGIDEGIGHLAMKAFMALLSTCGDSGECGSAILWGMVMLWLVTSLGTLWWLRTVFRRYDVTQALPIEYGGVMVCDALSAIIFYKEDIYMENWQLMMTLAGVASIIIGIIVGRMCEKSNDLVTTRPRLYQRFPIPSCCVKQSHEAKMMCETYDAPKENIVNRDFQRVEHLDRPKPNMRTSSMDSEIEIKRIMPDLGDRKD